MHRKYAASIVIPFLLATGCFSGNTGNAPQETETETEVGVGNITMDPCAFSFGEVSVGSLHTQPVTISNSGTSDLVVQGISAGGPFTINATIPVTVIPSNSYQFTVVFEPTTFDSFSEQLIIQSDDPDSPQMSCPISGEVRSDGDGDGFDSVQANGTDCDDDDPTVYPGTEEQWYDGIDQDCDGNNDYDQDGDGFMSSVYNKDPKANGGDCQDVDPTINPNADDEWYDGVDQDCDGANDYDQDGDGYSSADYSGSDCDDTIDTVNPGGEEVWNGLDDDCNDFIDDNVSEESADLVIEATSNSDLTGTSIAGGDFDDDGVVDLVIGSPGYSASQGQVTIFFGGDWVGATETADATDNMVSGYTGSTYGAAMANLGDFTGDGIDDLVVSAPNQTSNAGVVGIYSGPDLTLSNANATTVILSGWENMSLGEGVMGADIDGDGLSDMISFSADAALPYNYMAVHYGGASGVFSVDEIDATWMTLCGSEPTGANPRGCGLGNNPPSGGSDNFANNANASADIDGDGYADLLIGDGFADPGGSNEGKIWILWGRSVRFNGYMADLDATASVLATGTSSSEELGRNATIAEDADGDGDAEIWFTSDGRSELYMVHGDPDLRYGSLDLGADIDASFETGGDTAAIGNLANLGDFTGDGIGDIGVAYYLETDNDNGEFRLLENSTSWSGSYDLSTSFTFEVVGGDEGGHFSQGISVTPVDLNADGKRDLLIGDPDGGKSGDGRAFIFLNYSE